MPSSSSQHSKLRYQSAALAATASLLACTPTPPPTHSLEVAVKSVQTGALSDDGEFALIGSLYHGGSLWRLHDGERLFNWNHAQPQSDLVASAFSPNGRWAITADTGSTLVLWNTRTGEAERYWSAPGRVLSVSLDSNAQHALLGLATGEALLFDIRRGGILQRLEHGARVNSVALGKSGRSALTGSDGGKAVSWDVATGNRSAELAHDDDVQLVALSQDETLALSVSKYDRAVIWSTRSGDIIGDIPLKAEQLKRGLRFTAAAFDETNQRLLTGRPDGVIELWNVQTLQRLQHWQLPKRDAWQPTGAAALDVAFGESERIHAIASNGFVHSFQIKKPASTE